MSPRPTHRPSVSFQGVRYALGTDGYYKAERTKRGDPEHWTLHRAVWAAAHGPVPRGWDVVFSDGDLSNVALSNLRAQPRSRRPVQPRSTKRTHVTFNGDRYYLCLDGYYQCARTVAKRTGEYLLHRAVWAAAHGPVSDGVHVHHIDGDRGNNDLANLIALDKHDHISEHKRGPRPGWGPEQSGQAGRLRRAEWARRQPRDVSCDECGQTFQSTGMRARFCSPKCRRRLYHREGRSR
jgi:hypothetical protein